MVDVTEKIPGERRAVAEAFVVLPDVIQERLKSNDVSDPTNSDINTLKILISQGPVFATAVIAGTQAAKQTSSLIPLCHQLPVTGCSIDCQLPPDGTADRVRIVADVRTRFGTGVEMEALTAASVTALTVIDMLKAWSPAIRVDGIRLLRKTGGKRDYRAADTEGRWTGDTSKELET